MVRLSDVFTSMKALFRRRFLAMLAIAVPLFVILLVVIAMLTPKYDAVTRIRIDPSRNPLSSSKAESPNGINSETIETEIGVMNSLEVAREVSRRLKLHEDPEFRGHIQQGETSGRLTADEQLNAVARRLMAHVTVGRDKLSYIISVKVQSDDPQKAARIANSFANAYLDMRVGSKIGTAERQSQFFQRGLVDLAKEVNAADQRLATYRANTGIAPNDSSSAMVDQQIAPLSSQIATAEAAAAAARSNVAVARQQIGQGGLDAVSEVRNSNVIADMRRQRADIMRNMGEVQTRYGARHPESIRVQQQLASIDQQIQDEANRVVNSLAADASAAQAKVQSLRSTMTGLEGQRATVTRASATAEGLARDAASKRAAYDRMYQLSLESTQSARNSIAQAEVVDIAQPPSGSTSPNKPLLGILALMVSSAIGLGSVMVIDLMQGGLRSADDVEDQLGLPVIATVPLQGTRRGIFRRIKGRGSPAQTLIEYPATLFAESFRNARTSLIGVNNDTPPRVIAFTSALPNEGKTTSSLSLARVIAMNADSTLLIDCDLRRAGLLRATGASSETGLVEVLNGTASIEDAIVKDSVQGLDLLPVARPFFTAEDMFGHDRMTGLLERAKGKYDFIILDLPPLLGVADARSLAGLADATVMIVKWGATPVQAVEMALSSVQTDGSKVVGVMLTMVDPNSEAIGGTYYSKQYAHYYQNA